MAVGANGDFLEYHEPGIISVLTLISFFVVLAVAEWLSAKIFRAGLIGQIIVGLVYGAPIGNILAWEWQETFLALGYIGLILIIFEGGLTIRLDLLKQNLLLSIIAALVGILAPIALSFALLYAGFGHTALEAFILGTSLCSTSLGTTLVILTTTAPKPSATKPAAPLSQTRIGTVLVSAAVIDDVCGLVLVSVIQNLRDVAAHPESLGWTIGRPVLASSLLAVITPLVARYGTAPLFRVYRRRHDAKPAQAHAVNFGIMVGVLSALVAGAAYAGASMLFGAFLAGGVVASLREESENVDREMLPSFVDTFERYVSATQQFVLQPLFFASIGFAIPFKRLWAGEVLWKGLVYAILMLLGKVVVGACVPVWDLVAVDKKVVEEKSVLRLSWAPAALLGSAMVARGEIGLLIIQIGLNETPFLTEKAFVIGVWAIVLNTVVGPVVVGLLVKRMGARIAENPRWGVGVG
ncbi:Cation/H+ exchanger [Cercophora scortea]|uniref:Cation/H+ exchanger n=1 Tax=Cercophora scortea TaxID=314031 RepID=A0AAE0IDL3_9PEZI|nr:Cation/H+ exchanger [Cercophora scortea]